jgi:uroporphyrinogen decarboxylase
MRRFDRAYKGAILMTKDVMTPEERLQASIGLKPIDRVCCAPFISSYAGQFAGITNSEFVHDWDKAMSCIDKLKAAYPVWDCYRGVHVTFGDANLMKNTGFTKFKFPGEELPENAMYQVIEEEFMTQEDVRNIKNSGFGDYFMKLMQVLHGNDMPALFGALELKKQRTKEEIQAAYNRGQSAYYGCNNSFAFEFFSMTRSMDKFVKDIYKMKDELIEIMWLAQKDALGAAVAEAEATGVRRCFVAVTRCTPMFLSPKNFEKFAWPFLKDFAEQLIANNITPILHIDTDFGRDLEYLLQLPRGKCIVEFDGTTDMFRAKDVLKDHICIAGDVPAALLCIGSAAEIDEYCKRLFNEVGKGGGFILSSGCTLPMNSKHENVKAMFDAVEKYGRYN